MYIRVILADDHAVVRDGIRSIIERLGQGIEIVGEASNGAEVLELAEKRPADVYILDISMPLMNGIETAERLLKMDPRSRIVILSMYNDKILVERAFKNGAKGYILKESAAEEIIRAIREVYAGRFYLSSIISGHVVQAFLSRDLSDDGIEADSVLTSRQREILKLICEGKTEKEIARQLNISPHTVHVHKNNIMKILDIHTKAGLIRYGMRMKIIPG